MSEYKIDVGRLKAPTAKQLYALNTASAVSIRAWLENVISIAPESMTRAKNAIYDFERHFKGAIWELFWWFHLSSICVDIEIEAKTNLESKKSVDFLAKFPSGKQIALEISTLSDNHEEIQREYNLGGLHHYLESHLYGPYKYIHLEPLQFEVTFEDYELVLNSLQDWLNRISFTMVSNQFDEPSFRLCISDKGVVIDFRALGYDKFSRARPGILRAPAPTVEVDAKERLRNLILTKAAKKDAVPDCPLVIAITESGGFMSGTLWSRATALIGDECIRIYDDRSQEVVHKDNGIFLGASGWRNTGVSAVILSAANIPSSDFGEYEIWIHGGAELALEPEDFGFKARYFRINADCVEEFQGPSAEQRWIAIPLR